MAKNVSLGIKIPHTKETAMSKNRVHKPKQDWRAITVGTQPKETLLGVTHKIPKQNGNIVTFSGVMLGAARMRNVKIIVER